MRGMLYKVAALAISVNLVSVFAQGTFAIYDNMSGGLAYDRNGGDRVDDSFPVVGFSFVAGQTARVTGLELPLWSEAAGGKAILSLFSIDPGSGMPGTLLETMRYDAGLSYYPASVVSIQARGDTVLRSGDHYWLVLSTDPGSKVYWQIASKEIYAPYFSHQLGTDMLLNGRIGAFSVEGMAVPEPSASIVFIFAGSLLLLLSSKERWRAQSEKWRRLEE